MRKKNYCLFGIRNRRQLRFKLMPRIYRGNIRISSKFVKKKYDVFVDYQKYCCGIYERVVKTIQLKVKI